MDLLDSYHFDLQYDDPPHNIDFDGSTENISVLQGSKKRKKVQLKTVVCVPITGDASRDINKGLTPPTDSWAWRKYGQKPIKGSPYPRSYYRCSSSKGCTGRKQVERSRGDSSMLIVTYTADHDHANNSKASSSSSSSSSLKGHGNINEATLTVDNNDDDADIVDLSTSPQTHSPTLINEESPSSLPTFHNPNTSHFPSIMSSSHSSSNQYPFDQEEAAHHVVTPTYSWGPMKEECIAGEWQEDEYYYIIDEKKDNMSLCLSSRCEEDDFFSELGTLPELASIFNNKRNSVNNMEERAGPDEVRPISLDHEHAIFTSPSWSSPPCPLA